MKSREHQPRPRAMATSRTEVDVQNYVWIDELQFEQLFTELPPQPRPLVAEMVAAGVLATPTFQLSQAREKLNLRESQIGIESRPMDRRWR